MRTAADDDVLLDDWLAGDLADAERAALAERLIREPALAQRLLQRAQLEGVLSRRPMPALAAPATERPVRRGARRPKRRGTRRRRAPVLIAAGLGLALVAVVLGALLLSPASQGAVAAPGGGLTLAAGSISNSDTVFEPGDRLPTGSPLTAATALTLTSPSGDRLQLGGVSQLRIDQATEEAVAVTLSEGRLAVSVTPRSDGGRFAVTTPELRTEVLGTAYVVERDGAGSRVSVRAGRVAVTADGLSEELGAGETRTRVRADSWALPSTWDQGRVSGDLVQLEAEDSILAAGFGDPDGGRDQVLRFHPDLVLEFEYRANADSRWLGLWLQVPATGSTYYLPLGQAVGDGAWHRLRARLGDVTAKGSESRPLRPGDPVAALRIQSGHRQGAGETAVRGLRLIGP